jgi:dihydrofolate reductase
MSKVVFDISISLDGFITGPEQATEGPLGRGGEQLHEWAFNDERGKQLLAEAVAETGAIITGRRTYEDSLPYWGADGPTGSARIPTFVLTHEPPASSPEGGVYTFVDGTEAAVEQAKAAAGGKTVAIGGGGDSAWQFISEGLVDEISLHVVPILLGGGTRLFGELDAPLVLDQVAVDAFDQVTHLRYRLTDR